MIARIYIAGPYTKGDVAVNVHRAYEAANQLADLVLPLFCHTRRTFGICCSRDHISSGST